MINVALSLAADQHAALAEFNLLDEKLARGGSVNMCRYYNAKRDVETINLQLESLAKAA